MGKDILIKNILGHVAILKLNRPKQANALNKELFTSLTEELETLKKDDDVRVVIITGSGEKAEPISSIM